MGRREVVPADVGLGKGEEEVAGIAVLMESGGVVLVGVGGTDVVAPGTAETQADVCLHHGVFAQGEVGTGGELGVEIVAAIVEVGLTGEPVVEAVGGGGVEGEDVRNDPRRKAQRGVDADVVGMVDQGDVHRLGMVDAARRDRHCGSGNKGENMYSFHHITIFIFEH